MWQSVALTTACDHITSSSSRKSISRSSSSGSSVVVMVFITTELYTQRCANATNILYTQRQRILMKVPVKYTGLEMITFTNSAYRQMDDQRSFNMPGCE